MYGVLEIKSTEETMIISEPVTKPTKGEAEQVFHLISSQAAVSSIPTHTVAIINAEGTVVKRECYKHTLPQNGGEE